MERQRKCRDRGSIAAEWVLCAPAVVLLMTLLLQVGLWAHAIHTAQAAAGTALTAAAAETGSAATGDASATATVAQISSGSLTDAAATVERGTETVTVTVTGKALQIVPGLHLPVEVTVTGPTETFRPDTGSRP